MSESVGVGTATAERLVASHRQFLGFLERRLGDRALAEDLLQDAFVRTMERGGALRDEGAAVAWFYRLLRNAVIDQQRAGASRRRSLDLLARELADAAEPPPEIAAAVCSCVGELAATLKPEYAEAIRRVELDGLAVGAYAAESGITAGNAAVRLFRAREALRKQVRASCRTCAEHGCLDCSCARSG